MIFSETGITITTTADAAAITNLLNSAYRGDDSKKGWTTEAHLIDGNIRSTEEEVRQVMQKEGSVILKYTGNGKQVFGCVNLQLINQKIYLGMFAVSPQQQDGGIGKKLLQAAEEYARATGCSIIYMTVISVRTELISWYQRHGYKDTGQRIPFTDDGRAGKHLQPLEFMMLEKTVL
jgi:ribosomal protein S18 acetylase RimI-like enzyme